MRIFIPSYGRAGNVTTLEFMPNAQVIVPQSQLKIYQDHYGDSVIAIPDDQDGNVAKKRNAILNLMHDDELAWLVDDDLIDIIRIKGILSLDAEEVLYRHWELLDSYNGLYGGFAISDDPVKYAEYCPFSLTKPSYGCVMIRKHSNLLYDETLGRHEDADYFLKVLHAGGVVIRDNRYFFKFKCNKSKATNRGGIEGSERDYKPSLDKLCKRWGSVIKIKKGQMMGINSPRNGA